MTDEEGSWNDDEGEVWDEPTTTPSTTPSSQPPNSSGSQQSSDQCGVYNLTIDWGMDNPGLLLLKPPPIIVFDPMRTGPH
jgi:hypothetical protein